MYICVIKINTMKQTKIMYSLINSKLYVINFAPKYWNKKYPILHVVNNKFGAFTFVKSIITY